MTDAAQIETLRAHHQLLGADLRCSLDEYCAVMVERYGIRRNLLRALIRMGWYLRTENGIRFCG